MKKKKKKTRIPQTINQKPFKHKLNDGRKKYGTYETDARNVENVFSFTHFNLRLVCAWHVRMHAHAYLCAHSWSYVCKKKCYSYYWMQWQIGRARTHRIRQKRVEAYSFLIAPLWLLPFYVLFFFLSWNGFNMPIHTCTEPDLPVRLSLSCPEISIDGLFRTFLLFISSFQSLGPWNHTFHHMVVQCRVCVKTISCHS